MTCDLTPIEMHDALSTLLRDRRRFETPVQGKLFEAWMLGMDIYVKPDDSDFPKPRRIPYTEIISNYRVWALLEAPRPSDLQARTKTEQASYLCALFDAAANLVAK